MQLKPETYILWYIALTITPSPGLETTSDQRLELFEWGYPYIFLCEIAEHWLPVLHTGTQFLPGSPTLTLTYLGAPTSDEAAA